MIKYPEEKSVDWVDFSNRAKAILLQFGKTGGHYFMEYEDDFIRITYDRHHYRRDSGFLEVTRKKMPEHRRESLHNTTNPLFMESDFKVIRTHGEGSYIYQHLIDLTTKEKEET
jgi:hypothetical protein